MSVNWKDSKNEIFLIKAYGQSAQGYVALNPGLPGVYVPKKYLFLFNLLK